jgi:hypothetical protein
LMNGSRIARAAQKAVWGISPRPRSIRREEYPEAWCLRCIVRVGIDRKMRSVTSMCKMVAEIDMFRFVLMAGIMHETLLARMNV